MEDSSPCHHQRREAALLCTLTTPPLPERPQSGGQEPEIVSDGEKVKNAH